MAMPEQSGMSIAYRYRLYWTHPGVSTSAAMKVAQNGKWKLPDFIIDYNIRVNQLADSIARHAKFLVKKYKGGVRFDPKIRKQVRLHGDNNPTPLKDFINGGWSDVLRSKVEQMGLLANGPEHNSVARSWKAAIGLKKSESLPLEEGFPRIKKNRRRWSYAIQPTNALRCFYK